MVRFSHTSYIPFLLLMGMLLFTLHRARAQTKFNLTGIVKASHSGEPLPHATIKVKGTNLGTFTNTDGLFTLLDIPTQSASALVVSYLGYLDKEILIQEDFSGKKLEIKLESSEYVLDEVIIATGAQTVARSSGISQISINPAQIQNLPSLGERDIFRTLQLMPGISGSNEASSGLFVRGGTPDQNLILLDGFTVYHVDHFFGFFSAFNANAIKDVQLYKGGFEAKYGGRLSSVVEMTGKQGNTQEFDLDAAVGFLSGNLSLEIPLGKKGSILLAGRHSYPGINNGMFGKVFDLFVQEPENMAVVANPSFQFYDANAKITLLPTEKDVVAISFYTGQDDLDNSRTVNVNRVRETRRGEAGVIINNQISDLLKWGNRGISAKWSRKWNERWYSNAVLGWSNYFSFREQVADGQTTVIRPDTSFIRINNNKSIEDNDVFDLTLRVDNEFKINANNSLGFGTQISDFDISYKYNRNDTIEILNREDRGRLYAFYLQDSWKPIKGLELKGGIRASYFQPTQEWYWAPRLSANYSFENGFTLKGAWGRYYQFSNRVVREDVLNGSRDFWVLADGTDISVGDAWHYIAGASYEWSQFLIDVEFYEKQMSGLSEFSLRFDRQGGGRGAQQQANEYFFTGTGVSRGMEILLQKTKGIHTGWISYTLAEVVHDFPNISDYAYYALHHQLHELKIVQSFQVKNFNISGTWVYAAGKPYTAPGGLYEITTLNGDEYDYINVGSKNSEQLPSYQRLDFSASYQFKIKRSGVKLGFSIFNFLNRENVWYKEFEIQGNELIETNFELLGFTPNLFLNFNLK